MAFDRALHRAAWRNPTPGLHSIVFAVSDGEITTHQRLQIHVTLVDSGPRFISHPATRTRQRQLYTYHPQVDSNNSNALAYTLVEGHQRMHVDRQTGMVTWIATDTGPTLINVALRVSDGGRQQTQRFQIRLVEGNSAPIVISEPIKTARIDSLCIYTLLATDGDTLVYTVACVSNRSPAT